jgi:AraC-like DNA-binding protein
MVIASHKLGPTERLAPFVAYVRVTRMAPELLPVAANARYRRLPDGQLELVLRLQGADSALHVVGTRTTALYKHTLPATEFVTVRFKVAGAYPFFGVPISALTDETVPLEQLWGGNVGTPGLDRLQQALARAASSTERVAAVECALARRLAQQPYEPASVATVRRAVRLLCAAPLLPTVDALARQLGSSERQLRRAFADVVGVGPKQYLRVLRFQRALRRARHAPHESFSAIASGAGYCDQAHLNAEFQALAGSTPGVLCPRLRGSQVAR